MVAGLGFEPATPFRGRLTISAEAPGIADRARVEGFFYPHCVALVVTFGLLTVHSLEQAVEAAFDVRRRRKLRVSQGGAADETLSLDQFADRTLNVLRAMMLDKGQQPGLRAEPFSVVTVIRGAGVDPGVVMPVGGSIHRALQAVTAWSPSYLHDSLSPLDEAKVGIRQRAPISHILGGTVGQHVTEVESARHLLIRPDVNNARQR